MLVTGLLATLRSGGTAFAAAALGYPLKVTTFPGNSWLPGCDGRGPQDRSLLAQQFTELDHTSLPPASKAMSIVAVPAGLSVPLVS